jgi:GH15 family glucan-1,4-alpha-glucosidase
VRLGNGASSQCQLDPYGEVLQTAWLYAETGHRIERDIAHRLAETADTVCELWTRPDAGIWESRGAPAHHTQSKMMCWIALERAAALAERGIVPGKRVASWRREQRQIREFVETRCWSKARRSYVGSADTEDLDAAVLLGPLQGYADPRDERLQATDAIRGELGDSALVRRYAADELGAGEGAFLACSFWVAEALARGGRLDEAIETMETLVDLANDEGFYSEEVDIETGAFLGNLPQGLSHLSLISAATAIDGAER